MQKNYEKRISRIKEHHFYIGLTRKPIHHGLIYVTFSTLLI